MTRHFPPIETRSAIPIETRDTNGEGNEPDPIEAATAAVEELRTATTQRVGTVETNLTALQKRLDDVERRAQRIAPAAGETQDAAAEAERRAFVTFARRGREALTPDEVRTLRVADDVAGGYLAPADFRNELLRDLVAYSPIRAIATVANTTAGSVILPTLTGRPTAKWVGEIELRPYGEPTFGQTEIQMHEAAVYTDVSNWLLEDAAIDLEAELRRLFAEEFGRLESEAFLTGDGVKRPLGIMTDPRIPAVANGHATALKGDALISLYYALPQAYRGRATWLLNSNSQAALRLLKDTNGRYLWQDSLADGEPATLLGRPVTDAPEMADIAATTTPVIFGDFSAYRIFDRVNLAVLRDPYSRATEGVVRFHARRRVGGAVVRPEAFRKLAMTV